MEAITTEEKYNEKVENFKAVYNDKSVSLKEKIKLCEEFAYCDYVKGSERIDFAGDLAEMYLKAGRYQDVINFINDEFKSHFTDSSSWWMFIAGMLPFYTFYVIDACIGLKDYQQAKGYLGALKMNREKMLEMHPNDSFTNESKYWYARVIAKYTQIAILEKDISAAYDYLTNEIFKDTHIVETYYYMGIISLGNIDAKFKDISLAINCFSNLCELEINSDKFGEEEINMIISSNYYLGLIYATENGYKTKDKAVTYLTKAKKLGYAITDVEIKQLTENIIDSAQSVKSSNSPNKSGGCYVATCIYGSYDCPSVWTLRRFRDNILAINMFGKMFIRLYYAVSTTIVKMFGKYEWFHKMWRKPLDRLVSKLQKQGVEDTPYSDS